MVAYLRKKAVLKYFFPDSIIAHLTGQDNGIERKKLSYLTTYLRVLIRQ